MGKKRIFGDDGVVKIVQVVMKKEDALILEASSFFTGISQAEIVRQGIKLWISENPLESNLLNRYRKVAEVKREIYLSLKKEKDAIANESKLLPRV